VLELCVLQYIQDYLDLFYIWNILLWKHAFTWHGIKYTCWNILSARSCLMKLVDYQWNTIYCVLERLPGYIDNWKEPRHGLGYGSNTDLHD
jgi:hypothetical protein